MSCFQSLYPINNRFNLVHSSFSESTFSCTLLLHQPTLINVVFLPCLVFSLMRCQNTSCLQDSCFYPNTSLICSFVLFSEMSNLGNYSLCLSSQPCNILLWHPSNDVQHVLSLCGKYSFDCFPFTIAALTSSGFFITVLVANKTELPAFKTLSKMIDL